jgi:hypothetical protein
LRLFWPILRLRFNMRFLRSSFCSVLFTKKAINHSLVWPTQHWKQSTYKRLFPLGQADVLRWIDGKRKICVNRTELQSVTVTNHKE